MYSSTAFRSDLTWAMEERVGNPHTKRIGYIFANECRSRPPKRAEGASLRKQYLLVLWVAGVFAILNDTVKIMFNAATLLGGVGFFWLNHHFYVQSRCVFAANE